MAARGLPGRGSRETVRDDDGDGALVLTPQGGSGEYSVTLSLGEAKATETVSVPESGLVTLTFRPAAERQVLVAYSGGFGVEEIFVTARRRAESLQSTPISITAFTEEGMRERSALDGRLTWVLGGLYFEEDSDAVGDTIILEGLLPALESAPGPIFSPPGVPAFLCDPGRPPRPRRADRAARRLYAVSKVSV